ncbi:PREDICTED: proto-oncogene tyrosine-protein kinase receptor Ret-like [Polistes dominula]|uniref:Proto-oncogene tyrosine-protein kinase receptor Ret-like n=1 Tax=Polistes dominula TaxID=743375 RepID=A0ABM1I4U2_POLDO|nr:PREDICTED: proto-oncogene tyrosine-protein kinase receptor Ret-like [Polistes dominula]XP_015175228.1 PREDICTED: proto-oncogene tyrosine-protein kinase receptor Ret-like [Polistes dominula]XP_015175229.1 PREDICTED: proto-oncogene tyrosine-protein kinase receptor Ret-like [Polistes dominula]
MKDPVTRIFAFLLIIFWTLLLKRISPSAALYFPQSNLVLRLPTLTNNSANFSSNLKLLTLRTLRNDSTIPKKAKYQISTRNKKISNLDKNTNTIWLSNLPNTNLSDTIIVRAKENDSNEAVMEIKIQPLPTKENQLNCADYVQDMCFWNTSRYKIYENQPRTMLGSFGPEIYNHICPHFRVTGYDLMNGTDYFQIINNTLYTNTSLDRDTLEPEGGPGPRADISVRCIVYEDTGEQYVLLNTLSIEILDQDDNPPVIQNNLTSVNITVQEFTAGDRLDENNVLIRDSDEIDSNQFTLTILEDVHNALNFTYTIVPIDHPSHPEHPVYTFIYTRFHAKTTLLPKSPYTVILRVKDESLLPEYGENEVNVTISFYGPEHRKITPTAASISLKHPINYPENVRIARVSPRYYRVAQPTSQVNPRISFSIHGSEAFNVTEKGGIVHVIDTNLLKTAPSLIPLKLELRVGDQMKSSITIKVNLIDVQPTKMEICNEIEGIVHSCANAESRQDCELNCGVGGGILNNDTYMGHCIWRLNNSNILPNQMSERYATCSPNLNFCPDYTCDELERLDPRICPQDCTIESEVHFAEMNKGGRGIKSGLGICSCNDMVQCTCGPESFRKDNTGGGGGGSQFTKTKVGKNETNGKLRRDRDKNEEPIPGARKASTESCGPICIISVFGAATFVILVIFGFFVTLKYRKHLHESSGMCVCSDIWIL